MSPSTSNSERIGRGLELLRDGLATFVEREMKEVYGGGWLDIAEPKIPNSWNGDVAKILKILWNHWNSVFRNVLGHVERSYVSELMEVRKCWAHQEIFTDGDVYRYLDTMNRLLISVSAPEAKAIKVVRDNMRSPPGRLTRNKGNIRGYITSMWENNGKPNWNLQQTIDFVKEADKHFRKLDQNPAPALRENINEGDHDYIHRWVLGCHFEWINPR